MKKVILSIMLVAFVLAGCNEKPDLDEEREVVIFFSARSLSTSLKSSDSESENNIQKIILFGVDEQSSVVKKFAVDNPSLSGEMLTIPRKIKTLYAIANPTSKIDGANPTDVSEILGMTIEYVTPPYLSQNSVFLMSGKADIISKAANIPLVRTVAKINITGINGFQITSVTVQNTSSSGYVFQKTPLSVPVDKTNYDPITESDPTFYIAENTISNSTKFVINGQLSGKPAQYTILQLTKDGGTPVAIQRNTYYKVVITPITEDECSIKVNIPDWDYIETDEYIFPD